MYREETTEGDEYSIGGEDVDFLKYVEKMVSVFNVGRSQLCQGIVTNKL